MLHQSKQLRCAAWIEGHWENQLVAYAYASCGRSCIFLIDCIRLKLLPLINVSVSVLSHLCALFIQWIQACRPRDVFLSSCETNWTVLCDIKQHLYSIILSIRLLLDELLSMKQCAKCVKYHELNIYYECVIYYYIFCWYVFLSI